MPATKDPEFRRRAVELAGLRERPIAQVARDLGIAESGLRRWMTQAEVEVGKKDGLTSDERAELVKLRRDKRVLEMEVEILKRASAYFARENILPDLCIRKRPQAHFGLREGTKAEGAPGPRRRNSQMVY